MPVTKDAMSRYRIIDKLLSDPNKEYTTEAIWKKVKWECQSVSLRMIQKDIKTLEDEFDKVMVRNEGGRGTVRYEDQSSPLFYKELTEDEEEVLREVLQTLGQFDGLDNFTWLDLLKKKLSMAFSKTRLPYISFSKNEGLQIPKKLLGRLFTAISRKKTIEIHYAKFGEAAKSYQVYPYQLKQYNDRWFLICTPVGNDEFPYDPEFIANFALDRMEEKFEYLEEIPYLETPVDLQARFDEIIGVTLFKDQPLEDIYFAVSPEQLPYVESKWLHITQMKLYEDYQNKFHDRYPSLKDYTFFTISCRENHELYSKFASYHDGVILVEPVEMREKMKGYLKKTGDRYEGI